MLFDCLMGLLHSHSIPDYRDTSAGIDVGRAAWAWFLFQIFLWRKKKKKENKIQPKDLLAFLCSKRDGFLPIPEVKP